MSDDKLGRNMLQANPVTDLWTRCANGWNIVHRTPLTWPSLARLGSRAPFPNLTCRHGNNGFPHSQLAVRCVSGTIYLIIGDVHHNRVPSFLVEAL